MSKKKKELVRCVVCDAPALFGTDTCGPRCSYLDRIMDGVRSANGMAEDALDAARQASNNAWHARQAPFEANAALGLMGGGLAVVFLVAIVTLVLVALDAGKIDDIQEIIAPYAAEAQEETP